MRIHTETLIIGQGLAGSMLAAELLRLKRPFHIMDAALPKASAVAAGLVNPLVFRYLTLSWEAARNLQYLHAFAKQVEADFGQSFYRTIPILRIFGEGEQNLWESKLKQAAFKEHISLLNSDLKFLEHIHSPYGAAMVTTAGRFDINAFMNEVRSRLQAHNQISFEAFEHDKLQIDSNKIQYKNIEAQQIVFCEGAAAATNPLFDFIPFRPVKGEVLELSIKGLQSDMIINKDVFLLPLGNDLYRCGATYDWDDLSLEPTLAGRKQIEDKLSKFLKLPYEVIGHQAGIRPSIADRRPVCGKHPEHDNIWIFNGLGAKGVLLAPYLTAQLIAKLFEAEPEDKEVNPLRFWKK